MANLAPSEQLLAAFRNGKLTWGEFRRKYKAELWESSSGDKRNATIRNHGQKFTLRLIQRLARAQNVTLLCHCDEGQPHCHRRVLHSLLNSRI